MSAFNDCTCPNCNKRFGWTGKLTDCPPCPRCKYQIPKQDWEAEEKEMKAFEQLLLERKRDRTTNEEPEKSGMVKELKGGKLPSAPTKPPTISESE